MRQAPQPRMGETPKRFQGLPVESVLGLRVPVALSLGARLLGLALLERDRAGAGLLIPRCRAVHTFGMRFELDLVFLDPEGLVVELRRSVPPRLIARCRRASAVLELTSPLSPV